MNTTKKWELSKKQQEKFIDMLTPEIATLRAKAKISQGDLANIIGVSRQTYSAIECGNKRMSWSIYLSLILFYDYNNQTHEMLRNVGAFSDELFVVFNNGEENSINKSKGIAGIPESITNELDEAAFQAIRTAVMLEYARCTKQTGDAIIKSFDGVTLSQKSVNNEASMALKSIREKKNK